MPTYTMTGPDGQDYSIDGPPGASNAEIASAMQHHFPDVRAPSKNNEPSHESAYSLGNLYGAATEPIKSIATGAIAAPISGLAGIGTIIGNKLGLTDSDPADVVRSVGDALTYHPKTSGGKIANDVINYPMQKFAEGADYIGSHVSDLTGSPLLGASTNALIQGLPAILGAKSAIGPIFDVPEVIKAPKPGLDYTPLRDLTPEESARMQRMTDQGIKPTLAQVAREPEQFRFEDQTAKKAGIGDDLYTRELDSNDALINSLKKVDISREGFSDLVNERVAGEYTSQALRDKAAASIDNVGELYDKAKNAGETKALVDTRPLEKYLSDTDGEHPTLDVIKRALDRAKDNNGGYLSINDAENIYKKAGNQTTYGDPSSYYMGKVKSIINDITDGSGGDFYRAARKARLDHAMEFEDQGAIARLIEKKAGSRTDYKTAPEDVFNKTVVNSSLDELTSVVNSLKSGNPSASPLALKAYRALQAQTINYLLDRSTFRGVPNKRDANQFSPTEMRNGMNKIGADKLELLFGKDDVKKLNDIVKNAQNVKQAPGRVQGSDTSINLQDTAKAAQGLVMSAATDHLTSKIPGLTSFRNFMQAQKADKVLRDRVNDSLHPRKASSEYIANTIDKFNQQKRQNNIAHINDIVGAASPGLSVSSYAASADSKNRQSALNESISALKSSSASSILNDALGAVGGIGILSGARNANTTQAPSISYPGEPIVPHPTGRPNI